MNILNNNYYDMLHDYYNILIINQYTTYILAVASLCNTITLTVGLQARSQGGSIEPPKNLTYDAQAQICKARAARVLSTVCAGQGKNGWA